MSADALGAMALIFGAVCPAEGQPAPAAAQRKGDRLFADRPAPAAGPARKAPVQPFRLFRRS